MAEWRKINEHEWTRKLDDEQIEVLLITLYEGYILHEETVDLSTLTKKEMEDVIEPQFTSLKVVKEQHPHTWKDIVAINVAADADVLKDSQIFLDTEEELSKHLWDEYGIKAS